MKRNAAGRRALLVWLALATPPVCSPFVPVKNSLQTALTSKWLVVDLRSGPRFRDGFPDLHICLFWLSFEDLLQTGRWTAKPL